MQNVPRCGSVFLMHMDRMQQVRSGSLHPRLLSAIEVIAGAFVVIGHNVYHFIPNEVPILFVLGLLSLHLRDRSWNAFGLTIPSSWTRTVLIALAAAAVRILLGEIVIDPLTARFWPPAVLPSGAKEIAMNFASALKWLGIVWTFAAFGEEIGYRGYLLTRVADIASRSKTAYWLGVLVTSVLFGFGHYYKGPSGMIDSGVAGFILGSAYLLSGRNLWVCILAHAFIDTVGVIALFLGGQS
jgi:membrane protease YdiL (CAAX protease family)